ncbi:MAG: DUF4241 domain-containing protein, partial [Negativicutes bacterium]|nr:DUF4241 domain-containing protein [Negativicutes bacterium]
MKSFKKEIGSVGVDSGQLLVIDPCYLGRWKDDDFDQPSKEPLSYSSACQLTLSEEQAGELGNSSAVAFSSGFGDGVYPVIAHYKDYGKPGQPDIRIRKVE